MAIDNVGSQLFESIRRSMGIGGRWIMIGQLTGEFVPFNPAQLFLKNVSMLSATSTTRKQLDDCLALVGRGLSSRSFLWRFHSNKRRGRTSLLRWVSPPVGLYCVPTDKR